MNSIPKISVLMITYNQEKIVRRALDSLIAQKDYLYEICINDDCSTDNTFQVVVEFDDEYMYGSILSQNSVNMEYKVYNSSVSYVRENGKVYQIASVCRTEKDITTGKDSQKELYINRCEIGYELDGEIEIEERGANDD